MSSILPILSICIPTFNRKNSIIALLQSIDNNKDIEVVIIDDGSTDDIKKAINYKQFDLNIKFRKTINRGRSSALSDAIKLSSGQFIMIMDSDDYFIPKAIDSIIKEINLNKSIKCFLFGVEIKKNKFFKKNLPPKNLKANLLKLRADFKIKGDMKEVVSSEIIKKCIYKKCYKYRRTPTSLIWECVSRNIECLTINNCVVVKNFDDFGLTANISNIKYENPEPMFDLYKQYYFSNLYKSKLFRMRSKIQFYRYLFITKKNLDIRFEDIFFILLGFTLSHFDRWKYFYKNKIISK